ncbi:PorT family protein [Elizabethkingia sp. JS20170427COW]|uniref:PorT family protein n=1 Tax=Elizabethkingia sp. JS20170427COW TaxID=2583851 RepID=UPI0011104ED7|nr:PorT family protein [Elizabethkingia sp. JS20170427COW]QCX53953.1 PorT family protein [Elizabethkingia sp. JS20170427COW]
MKKSLLGLSILVGCLSLHAQKNIEITAGYGSGSLFGVANIIGSSVVDAILVGHSEDINSSGVLNFGINAYSNNMKWRYGIAVDLESFDEKNSVIKTQSFTSISPKVDYFWSNEDKKLRFYSGVSVGILLAKYKYVDSNTHSTISENDTHLGFNITPIGIRYGKAFGVYVEPNIGTRGFVQAGVSYIF